MSEFECSKCFALFSSDAEHAWCSACHAAEKAKLAVEHKVGGQSMPAEPSIYYRPSQSPIGQAGEVTQQNVIVPDKKKNQP